MVLEQVPDHQGKSAFVGNLHELRCLVELQCQRLLDEYVLAGRQRRLGQGVVLGGRGRDHDALHLGVTEERIEGASLHRVARGDGLGGGGIFVVDGGE